MAGFVAFDIEIATAIPNDSTDWKDLRPLGISCAATLTDAGDPRLWHGVEQEGGRLAERMSPEECQALVEYLVDHAESGSPILTWNGLGFDLDILQEECGPGYMQDFCHLMAYHDHIDMAFQMLCEKGFMCGLQAAALGMYLAGKTEGMHGDLAPAMWRQGRAEQDKVLAYCAQDTKTTADLYRAILKRRALYWRTKKGTLSHWGPTLKVNGDVGAPRMLTVEECLQLLEPDTSWMTDPWPRSKFTGWLQLPETSKPVDSLDVFR